MIAWLNMKNCRSIVCRSAVCVNLTTPDGSMAFISSAYVHSSNPRLNSLCREKLSSTRSTAWSATARAMQTRCTRVKLPLRDFG